MAGALEHVPHGLPRRLVIDPSKLEALYKPERGRFADVLACRYGLTSRLKQGVMCKRHLLPADDGPWAGAMPPAERVRQRELLAQELHMVLKTTGHPRLLQLIGYTIVDGRVDRVVTELASGSLRDFLHSRGRTRRLRPPELVRVLRHAAVGLAYLHSQNIVHGFLTNGNVLVFIPDSLPTGTADAKLCDFGIPYTSRMRNVDSPPVVPYLAPECVDDDGDAFTPSADVYSLGVLMVEVGSGRNPGTSLDSSPRATMGSGTVDPGKPDPYRRAADLAAILPSMGGLAAVARPCLAGETGARPSPAAVADQLSDLECELRGAEGLRIAADTAGLTRLADRLEEADMEKRLTMHAELAAVNRARVAAEDGKRKADHHRAEEWLARQQAEQKVELLKLELDEAKKEVKRYQALQNRMKAPQKEASVSPRATSPLTRHEKPKVGVPPVEMIGIGEIETWRVPRSGQYHFAAVGACGGSANSGLKLGGSGATCKAVLRLDEGQVLLVCVGVKGGNGDEGTGGGGGGATFVCDSEGQPLIVAGGGGGAGVGGAGARAWTKEEGANGQAEIGGGGHGGVVTNEGGSGGESGGAHIGGGGGAGWLTPGGGHPRRRSAALRASLMPQRVATSESENAETVEQNCVEPANAAQGGTARGQAGAGGFGGGGAGVGPGGGGGGGYCGGGGSCAGGGGGGGSFVCRQAGAPALRRGKGTLDGELYIEFNGD
eukprot:TRINITY_DN39930_c0_g1_i1.p1 TRINITY_DN39930_c0_g1~~TRINITY_DN39930_c0_g1_i1.p1  ORF type:complete len:718 (+),score=159.88 TRINITY_DN39930_c0_g1_i1:42-2195(+)